MRIGDVSWDPLRIRTFSGDVSLVCGSFTTILTLGSSKTRVGKFLNIGGNPRLRIWWSELENHDAQVYSWVGDCELWVASEPKPWNPMIGGRSHPPRLYLHWQPHLSQRKKEQNLQTFNKFYLIFSPPKKLYPVWFLLLPPICFIFVQASNKQIQVSLGRFDP